ncbi:MAG: hypothetical protein IH897_01650 [Planctomycetes bacterium]|nr:hypothetical protein [Planctomycetota bacterium]
MSKSGKGEALRWTALEKDLFVSIVFHGFGREGGLVLCVSFGLVCRVVPRQVRRFRDEIEEDEEEDFTFRVKADNSISPGDYQIPYTLKYDDGDEKERTGTIGIKVLGNSDISFLRIWPQILQEI